MKEKGYCVREAPRIQRSNKVTQKEKVREEENESVDGKKA